MLSLLTPAELAFRDRIRAEIRALLPPHLARRNDETIHYTRAEFAEWNRLLNGKGWAAHHWPKEYGGTGWTAVERFIFEAECAQAGAPPISVFGLYLVGPTLYTFANEAQKARYLPGILSGEEFWCQGYSEPEAGSDLASLRTTARRVEGGWIVNGQKAWTTEGQFADLMILLARTAPGGKPQAGLSLFVLPMDAPGIEIRPVITIDHGHSVNSVFLQDVFIPEANLIGEENRGWSYAKFLLTHERTNNAQIHRSRAEFERLCACLADLRDADGTALTALPDLRAEVAGIAADIEAVETTVLRVLMKQDADGEPGPEASIVKITGSELQQRISQFAIDAFARAGCIGGLGLAPDAAAYVKGWEERHLFRRVVTIYAGANEIQRNIIARTVLNMGG